MGYGSLQKKLLDECTNLAGLLRVIEAYPVILVGKAGV